MLHTCIIYCGSIKNLENRSCTRLSFQRRVGRWLSGLFNIENRKRLFWKLSAAPFPILRGFSRTVLHLLFSSDSRSFWYFTFWSQVTCCYFWCIWSLGNLSFS